MDMVWQNTKCIQLCAVHISCHIQIVNDDPWNITERAPGDFSSSIRGDVGEAMLDAVPLGHADSIYVEVLLL